MGIRRIHGLVTEPIDNELLIFNQATGEGHALNEPAASLPIIEPMPAPQASAQAPVGPLPATGSEPGRTKSTS